MDAKQVGADHAITFQHFDATRLPFEKAAFDAVFMMGALHHMEQPDAAVRECLRVLAPAGVLSILEPSDQLVELARARHPTHPDPADPTPFVDGDSLETHHGKMFSVYVIRPRIAAGPET